MTRYLYVFFVLFCLFYALNIIEVIFNLILNMESDHKNIFIFIFFTFFFISYFFVKNFVNYNFNFDLICKYYYLMLRKPSYLFNFIINNLKKIWLFLSHFRYYKQKYIINELSTKTYCLVMSFWRPLFKKFSYFGYYRSNRSKWIK